MISKYHSNRKLYNWLLYDIGDKFLEKYSTYYKGILYDLGCGEAPYKEFFLQYADKYFGVDWSGSCHDIKADIVADLNKLLPIENEVADTVISLSVMEHLCEPQTMLNEACRILKPNGTMILQVPWQWRIHEAPHDYFRYSPYGLEYMLRKAGFSSIKVIPQSGFFTVWIIKLNYFSNRFVRGPLILRVLLRTILTPFWYIGQKIAPVLDMLDLKWELESQGYFVIAKKSESL